MIAITGHFERPKVKRIAKKAEARLQKLGAKAVAADIKKKKFNGKKIRLVIAVGGDGTLLRVVRELRARKAVVGIAAGEQSALMQIKQEHLQRALQRIAKGKYSIQKRLRLQALAGRKPLQEALNEVMLVNSKSGAIINYCLYVNGKRRYCCRADACIVATPTGSTGHAYSAGGKRLPAGCKKIAVVPSNPLNRAAKPLYLKGGSKIALLGFDEKQGHEVVVDGQPRFRVKKRLLVSVGKEALFLKI